MISKNSLIAYRFIDPNIQGLVRLLNSLHGIRTMGCCGGHKNPTATQRPEGEWFVTFWVYVEGRTTTLPRLVAFVADRPTILMDGSHLNGRPARRGWYSLSGKGRPEDVAAELAAFLKSETV